MGDDGRFELVKQLEQQRPDETGALSREALDGLLKRDTPGSNATDTSGGFLPPLQLFEPIILAQNDPEGGKHKNRQDDSGKEKKRDADERQEKEGDKPKEKYLPEKLTNGQFDKLKDLGKTKEELEAIRREINEHGRSPADALVDSMKKSRVLAIGETHVTPNEQRNLGKELIPKLQAAGATHLALEIPKDTQPVLDEYMKTGKLDKSKLPVLLRDDDYLAMLEAARKAGLKLVAVDAKDDLDRDKEMAAGIGKILDADAKAKVVFWVGAGHLDDPPGDGTHLSAAEHLKKKYDTTTVKAELPDFADISAAQRVGVGLKDSVAIDTKSAGNLGKLDTFRPGSTGSRSYGHWDQIIIFPKK